MSISLTLSEDEIRELTHYQWPSMQLKALHKRGFFRARISERTGKVLLERDHYLAVCAGPAPSTSPRVRPPQMRRQA